MKELPPPNRVTVSAKRRQSAPPVLLVLWGTWVVIVILLALLKPISPGASSVVTSVSVGAHLLAAILTFLFYFPRRVSLLLSVGLLVRVGLVIWDIHFRHIFTMIHSGGDSEGFHQKALEISSNTELLSTDIYGGLYSKASGVLFHLIGPLRDFAQYTNALLFISAMILVYKTLTVNVRLSYETANKVLVLGLFFPNGAVITSLFLRESLIVFCVAASIYYFSAWLSFSSGSALVAAFVGVLLGSVFHTGVVVIAIAYVIAWALYQRSEGRFVFSSSSVLRYLLAVPVLGALVIQNSDLFLGKVARYSSSDEILSQVSASRGGSAYLQGLSIDSLPELVLFGPIKSIYFLASPMPWDFRGATDVIMFVIDSVFYIVVLALAIRYFRRVEDGRAVFLVSLLSIILVAFFFGAGVSNAGTALRHRFKIFPLFLVLYGVIAEHRQKNRSTSNSV